MMRRPHHRLPVGGYAGISSVRIVGLHRSLMLSSLAGARRKVRIRSRLAFGDLHDLDLSGVDLWSW